MYIGNVIKKYRKEMGLTQEEVANRLGVTTPAVNKWENGNSNPDIELLAPIARLLNISLDTLLSFHENLTDIEIEEIIRKMDKMFSKGGYDKTYEWALKIIKEYPNCNMLIWQVAVLLDSKRIIGECKEPHKYDKQINSWYEMALNDKNEKIQHYAAESLFNFYLRKNDYTMAEKYLNYFSDHDPAKKIYLGRLYKEQGKIEDAYKTLESVILSEYKTLIFAFSIMAVLSIEEDNSAYARLLEEKMRALSCIFDMGKYNEYSPMLNIVCAEKDIDGTFKIVEQLLNNIDSIGDFRKSKLYRHMEFKNIDSKYIQEIKEKLLEEFRNETNFSYMKGHKDWENLIYKN